MNYCVYIIYKKKQLIFGKGRLPGANLNLFKNNKKYLVQNHANNRKNGLITKWEGAVDLKGNPPKKIEKKGIQMCPKSIKLCFCCCWRNFGSLWGGGGLCDWGFDEVVSHPPPPPPKKCGNKYVPPNTFCWGP